MGIPYRVLALKTSITLHVWYESFNVLTQWSVQNDCGMPQGIHGNRHLEQQSKKCLAMNLGQKQRHGRVFLVENETRPAHELCGGIPLMIDP